MRRKIDDRFAPRAGDSGIVSEDFSCARRHLPVGDLSKPAGASGNARTSSAASTTGRPKLARARSRRRTLVLASACASADAVKNTSKLVVTVLVNATLRVDDFFIGELYIFIRVPTEQPIPSDPREYTELQGIPGGRCRHAWRSSAVVSCRLDAVDGKDDITFFRSPALASGDSAGTSSTSTPVTPGSPNADISPSLVMLRTV